MQPFGGGTFITLRGIPITVTGDARIEQDGAGLSQRHLDVGMTVSVEGTISGTTWTATGIRVASDGGATKENKITFLGKVTEVSAEKIKVEVTGTASDVTPVLITDNTFGDLDLTKGLLVMVRGFLNADLSVTAREIRLVRALEIKPARAKDPNRHDEHVHDRSSRDRGGRRAGHVEVDRHVRRDAVGQLGDDPQGGEDRGLYCKGHRPRFR